MAARGPRITGGALRGRFLPAPGPQVRPTTGQVREALFSRLGQSLDGLTVLDAFGGTGVLSFEALSRGAARAVIVERDRRQAQRIRAAAQALGVLERVELLIGDVMRRAPGEGTFDLVLMDPPYRVDPAAALALLAPRVGDALVLEHGDPGPAVAGLEIEDTRRYGACALTFYRPAR